MDITSLGILLLCVSGAIALLALAYSLLVSTQTLRKIANERAAPALDEAHEALSAIKLAAESAPPLIQSASAAARSAKEVLDDMEVVTSKTACVVEKVSEITHMPAEFAKSIAETVGNAPTEK